MANMLDYITWRGDLPFETVPVGEVDALILAQLAMQRWENAAVREGTLSEITGSMGGAKVSAGFTEQNDLKLLAAVHESRRFGSVYMDGFVNEVDTETEKQFSAITLHLPGDIVYVSLRGTDNTIVGWKEDCAMAFSKPVPAQEAAVRYLTAAAERYPGPLIVGGHSKGGNLAMYAAANVSDGVRERIVTVYNFDGPGLSDQMDAQAMYARIAGRLKSYVPQGSMVGLLLAHPDEYTVVKSNSVSVLQHDPYSWQVEGPGYVKLPALSAQSARFDGTFREWLQGISEDDRATLVDTLFSILSASNAQFFGREFWAGLLANPKSVLSAIGQVTPDSRKRILRMIRSLGKLAVKPAQPKGDAKLVHS